jgi:hypothetical protein
MDIAATYHAMIDAALLATGFNDKVMHVHVGLAIYVAAQIVLRTRRGSINAWLVVLSAEAGNEMMDRLFFGSWRMHDTLGDVFATLFWPTILALASLYRRKSWASRHARDSARHALTALYMRPSGEENAASLAMALRPGEARN